MSITGDYCASITAVTVIAMEPSIYIPEENLGVRIEDDVLITESGYNFRQLTRDPDERKPQPPPKQRAKNQKGDD
jgi:hypothetical protein